MPQARRQGLRHSTKRPEPAWTVSCYQHFWWRVGTTIVVAVIDRQARIASGIDRETRTVSHPLHPCRRKEDMPAMSIRDKAYIVGIYEHPTRMAADKSLFQLHAESAQGALEDAGLTKNDNDIDGYFCAAGDTPGLGGLSMVDYLGLKLKHLDSTDVGGSPYLLQCGHAAEAIALGKCSIALITFAGRPPAEGVQTGRGPRTPATPRPES